MPTDIVYIKSLISKLETDLELLKEAVYDIEKQESKKKNKKKKNSPSYCRAKAWYKDYVESQQK